LEQITFSLEEWSNLEKLNNGSSIQFPRLSRTITGRIIHFTSKEIILDANQLLQDGGNSSDHKEHLLSMIKERS
jgi:hypothetical protein